MEIIAKLRLYESALKEISKGRGPYNRDPLEHAHNCIEAMTEVAKQALKLEYDPDEDE